jgi:hypothetical protein
VALANPDRQTRDALRYLVAATGARLGAGPVPLEDPTPVGLGTVVLAAAVGARLDENRAGQVLAAAPPAPRLTRGSAGWAEAVARHGLVGPILTSASADLPAALADALLEASPLTMILHRPTPERRESSRAAAVALLQRPRGARMLAATFAAPSLDPAVLTWRFELLNQFRTDQVTTMLDCYLAARLWYATGWDARIRDAQAQLSGLTRPSDLAISTARFWLPLETQDRDERGMRRDDRGRLLDPLTGSPLPTGATIRGRLFLRHEDYGRAVQLARRHRSVLLAGRSR